MSKNKLTRLKYMLPTRDSHQFQGHTQTESKGQAKILHTNGNQKTPEAAILMSDKIGFKPKTVIRDKEGYYIMIKRSVYQEDMTILNI